MKHNNNDTQVWIVQVNKQKFFSWRTDTYKHWQKEIMWKTIFRK